MLEGFSEFVNELRKLSPWTTFGVVIAAFMVAMVVDYRLGFTHHYDTRNQLSQLERIEPITPDTAAISRKIDSLRKGILKQMEARQQPLTQLVKETLPLKYLARTVASSLIYFLFLIYTILAPGIPDRGQQLWGALLFFTAALLLGTLLPNIGGLLSTVAILAGIQIVSIAILARVGSGMN